MIRNCLSLLLLAVLVGCNGGEDFGSDIAGPVIRLPVGDQPIPGVDEDAVIVELVAAIDDAGVIRTTRVVNLGYTCTGAFAYIPVSGTRAGQAYCHPSATEVEFFIGSDLVDGPRVSIGKVFLPNCTGRSSGADCTGGVGFFQYSLADLIYGTAPKRADSDNPAVRNRAAMLAALDSTPADLNTITIPVEAHDNAGNAPLTGLGQTEYATFVNDWTPWLELVSTALGQPLAFPASGADAIALAQAAMARSRTGTYTLFHSFETYGLQLEGLPPIEINLPLNVMPGGEITGLGVVVGQPAEGQEASDLLAVELGAFLDDGLTIRSDDFEDLLQTRSLFDATAVALAFSGRVIGPAVYDGLTGALGEDVTDYTLDYSHEGVANIADVEQGRFSGQSYSDEFNAAPYRIQRTGYVSQFLDPAVMQLAPPFYRMTIYKACIEDPPSALCQERPLAEIEQGLEGNYPPMLFRETEESELETFQPQYEVPRDDYFSETFQVQILGDGSVITDSNMDCSAVDALLIDGQGRQEYRVGYISRTHTVDGVNSLNLIVAMVGPAELGQDTELTQTFPRMPHYGTRIEGRIHLDIPEMPIFRLGDENFTAGLRALWQDSYQFGRYERGLAIEPPYPVDVQLTAQSLVQGAVAGVGVDATCTPLTP